MPYGFAAARFVEEYRISWHVRRAEHAEMRELDFYSAGWHYEKAGMLLRRTGQEFMAVDMFSLSSQRYENEALTRAEWVKAPLFTDKEIGEEQRIDRILDCLDNAARAALFADEMPRHTRLSELADMISEVPGLAQDLRNLVRS